MKKKIALLLICVGNLVLAQTKLWTAVSESSIAVQGERRIIPLKYKTFQVDLPALKSSLLKAPHDKNTRIENSANIMELPMPDGSFKKFKVVESPVMEPTLAANYPGIQTYNVMGIDQPDMHGKLDVTPFGFHGMLLGKTGTVFIDPYMRGNTENYMSYYAADFVKNAKLICGEEKFSNQPANDRTSSTPGCAGTQLRTYRLALACTGEYAVAATGTVNPTRGQILAAVVTSINRVDGVYETEVAIKLVLVANDTALLFANAATDPYYNSTNGDTLLIESQNIIDSLVGSANYDIGHTFSTGGGGLATVGCVCTAGIKARGETGSANPVGDPFDIDYVAHEMGHQFGASHTFNRCTLSPTQAPGTMVEPGGGVTIMAYAGICGPTDDLQPHSIAYFHPVSFDQIMAYTTTGNGAACAATTASGNTPPVVASVLNYTIPQSTPFQLTGSATDANVVTYSWEETDNNSTPHNLGTAAPYFQSFTPILEPLRTFPAMAAVMKGQTSTLGEYLPASAQTLNFRLTVRDNKMGGGGVCSVTSQVIIAAAGPFVVTSQATPVTWSACSTKNITWNVAGTDAAPISAAYVAIYITVDTGKTLSPIATHVPNTGSYNITVPTLTTTHARIIIKAENNIFFAVNAAYITISGLCADFKASVSGVAQTSVDKGGAVSFTDLSAGNPSSWNWTFEGGTPATSAAQNPVITYNAPGTYSVSLIISDGVSKDTTSKKNYITVNAIYNTGTAYTCIAIDTNANIWAATNKVGVYFLNKKANAGATQFTELVFSAADPTKFVMQSIACDSLGNTWIGDAGQGSSTAVGGGLECINYNNPTTVVKHYIRSDETECITGNVNDGLATRNIQCVVVDKKNTVWCAQKYDDLTVSPNYYVSPGSFSYKASSSTLFTTRSTWTDHQNGVEPAELPYPAYVCNPTINQTPQTRTSNAVAAGPSEVWVSVYPYQAINGTSFPARILRYDLSGNFISPAIDYTTVGVPTAGGVFNGIYLTPKGDAWVTVGNKGFGARINGAWKFISFSDMPCLFPTGAIINQNAIWGNKFGNVFIGTTAGLIVYNGSGNVNSAGSYSYYALASAGGVARSITGGVSEKDSIQWIATNNGIVRTIIGRYDMTKADIDYTSCNNVDMNAVEAAIAAGENNQSYHSYQVTTIICDKTTSKYPDHCTADYVYNMLKNNVNFTAPTPPDYPTNIMDFYKQANNGILFTLLTYSPFVKAFDSLTTANLLASQNAANPKTVISCSQSYKLYNNAKSIVARYLYKEGPCLRFFQNCSWLAGVVAPFDYFNSMDDYCGDQLSNVQYDPIWIFANDKKKVITNYTAQGHILYPGKVERTVVEECGVVKIVTKGLGTQYCGDNCRGHLMGQANILIGKYLFNAVDQRLKTAFENGQ